MNLRPEQERALSYVRRRGTDASLTDIRSRVEETFREIERLVAPLAADVARTRPSPAAWSVHDIVDHLAVSDERAFEQLAGLLRNKSSATPVPASLQSDDPFGIDWPSLLSRFRLVHQRILSALEAASDDVPLSATAAVEMVVKCANDDGDVVPIHWVQLFDWKAFAILFHAHNREHIAQLLRTLESVERR